MNDLPVQEWVRRPSDRVLAALADGDLATARRLVDEGDGVARSLAKEFSLMYRGLGVTLRVIMGLLPAIAQRPGREATFHAHVDHFRLALSGAFRAAWNDAPAAGDSPTLAAAIAGAEATLAAGEEAFERVHAENAQAVRAALDAGDAAAAASLVRSKNDVLYLPVQDRLVRFMADTMALVYRAGGAGALARFHHDTASGQKRGFDRWETLTAREFAQASAFLLKQHMGECMVREDALRFTLEQKLCGSGGRLRRMGAYEGEHALPFVREPGPQTLGMAAMPVYCTHCPVWNAVAPLHWYGHPHYLFEAPARADGSCTAHIYKHPEDVPAAALVPLRG